MPADNQRNQEPQAWQVVESNLIVDLEFACLRKDLLEHPEDGRRFSYYYLQGAAEAAATVALTGDGCVILTRQYRHPVQRVLYDLPAGQINPGESPQQAAVRELEEETGYHAARWQKLACFNRFPGSMQVGTHLFLAQDLTPGEPDLDPFEDVGVIHMPFSEAMDLVTSGQVIDGSLMLGLLLVAHQGLAP